MTATSRQPPTESPEVSGPDIATRGDAAAGMPIQLDRSTLNGMLALSRNAYQVRDWTLLDELASEGLATHPNSYELLLLKARATTNLRSWSEAAASWEAVCNLRPKWPEAWYQRARASARMNDHAAAALSAQQLRSLGDGDPVALVFLTRIAFEIEDINGASEAFAKLVAIDRAAAERESGNFEREGDIRAQVIAVKTIRAADPAAFPDDERIQALTEQLLRRAISRERAELLADAYLDCKLLLDVYPDDALAQKNRARVLRALQTKAERLLKQEQFEAAAAAYQELSRCTPLDPNVLLNHGRILMRLRRSAEATPIWERLVEHFPDRREGYIQLARALDRSSQFRRAAQAWREVLAREPENAEALQCLSAINRRAITSGRTAITEGRYFEAWKIFTDLRIEDPDNEEPAQRLDQTARNVLKDMRTAYKEKRLQWIFAFSLQIPDLLKDSPEAQLLMARAATELHRYDTAVAHWRRLAEIDPQNNAKPHLQIARCCLRDGLATEAGAAIAELKARDPENPEISKMTTELRELVLLSGQERH